MEMLSCTLGAAFRTILDRLKAQTSETLMDYNNIARAEFDTLVDQCLNGDPSLMPILETVHSFVTSQYLLASSLGQNIGKISVRNHLDRLNPHRKPGDLGAIADSWDQLAGSMEAYRFGLPNPKNKLAMEADEHDRHEALVNMRDNEKAMIDSTNFVVGKNISVEVTDGHARGTVVANVSLSIKYINTPAIVGIYGSLGHPSTANERKWGYKVGDLRLVRDIIFTCDALDELAERAFNPSYKEASRLMLTKYRNQMSGFLSGNPSVASCAAIMILDSSTAQAIEAKAGGRLSDYHFRQKLFKDTTLMSMVVVDREWNSATFYHRNIEAHSEVPFQSLESAAKKQNFSITDILKSYSAGRAPTI